MIYWELYGGMAARHFLAAAPHFGLRGRKLVPA
jgi:hypothetical protein